MVSRWASWSCTLGFNVMGIYPEGYGTDDINMVARSPCHRFLAAADDRGQASCCDAEIKGQVQGPTGREQASENGPPGHEQALIESIRAE